MILERLAGDRQPFIDHELGLAQREGIAFEGGRAVGPEIAAVAASELLHVDETSWPPGDRSLWRWMFVSATVTLFAVAGRGRELLDRVLPGFAGWLMSDGWSAYRPRPRRLRCWAPLTRKAQGLIDSYDREAQAFGRLVQTAFDTLIAAIHAAHAGPPVDLPRVHADLQDTLREASGELLGTGTRKPARWPWSCGTTGRPSSGSWSARSGR